MMPSMRFTSRQLEIIQSKEQSALRRGGTRLTRSQAERWCLLHVGDDWCRLPLMLMAKGYNEDYENFTEVGAGSVYELDEGCYIALPEWWSEFELWTRESIDIMQ